MSKYTPGPWSIDWNVSRLDVHADGWTVCKIDRFQGFHANKPADDTAISNARLIAAAPEMLDALQRLADYATLVCSAFESGRPSLDMTGFPYLVGNARAAIAKATGEDA